MASIHDPSAAAWSRLDRLVTRFEDAWQRGDKPRLEAFLDDGATVHRAVLAELVLLDLQYRLKNGEKARVEDYLTRYPELAEETELILSLLASEYELRRRTEPELPVAEYEQRFPQFGKELTARLQAPRELAFLRSLPHLLPPMEPPPANGAPQVPGYEIVGELGRGGMGIVYKAVQLGLQRFVALKMVREGIHANMTEVARFRSEAVKLARMQHPHIVQIHDVSNEKEARPYFSMELVEGGSLTRRLGGTPLPTERAAEMMQTLARAIHYAHQRDLVHRDLKPDNVLLTADGTPKITDFGLSRTLDSGDLGGSYGTIIGTPSYMSPEQARGQVERIGPAADVYALGAILYELLTGRPPFRAATVLDTLEQVRNQKPVPLRQLQPKVPRDLETICLKCLHKDPADRYTTAEDLAEDLRRFLNHEPIKARPTPFWEVVWKWARRRPMMAILAATSTVASLALIGVLVWNAVAEHRSLADQRADVQALVMDAQKAFATQDWYDSARLAEAALVRAGGEPSLAELVAQAKQLQTESGRKEFQDREQTKYRQFQRLRDEALFHASLFTGLDLETNQKATRQAAASALDLFNEPRTDGGPLVLDESLDAQQKADIQTGCYELLEALTDAIAQPLPQHSAATRKQNAAEALKLLDRVGQLASPSKALRQRRARYLAQQGDLVAASKEADLAADMQPSTALDHFLLGDEHGKRQEHAEAIQHFRQALQKQPNHFWAHYYLAISLLRLEQFADAQTSLSACLANRADYMPALLLRSYSSTQLGIVALAAKRYEKASQFFSDAVKDLVAVQGRLKQHPNVGMEYVLRAYRGEIRRGQGLLARAQGDLQSCQRYFALAEAEQKAAIKLAPGQFGPHLNLALVYWDQEKWAEVAREYDAAVQLQPQNSALWLARAAFRLERKQVDEALEDLRKAIELDPKNATLRAEKARALLRGNQPEQALAACEDALQLQPNHILATGVRGEALLKLDRFAEAASAFDRCLQIGPAQADFFSGRGTARFKLGGQMSPEETEKRKQYFAGAVDDYTQAMLLKAEPDAELLTHRAWAFLQNLAWPLAERDAEEALWIDPRHLAALTLRAYARAQQHDVPVAFALADAEEVLGQEPETVELLHQIACTFALAAGRQEADGKAADRPRRQAIAALRQSLERFPEAASRQKRLERIQQDPDLKSVLGSKEFLDLKKEICPELP